LQVHIWPLSSGGDYYDAGWGDYLALSKWGAEGVDFSGSGNPLRQYCFNSVEWRQHQTVNPSSYYGITVWAGIDFDWFGNPFPFDHYDTAPVYLRISHYSPPDGGGGGGCPFVSLWDGSDFVLDNNVLPKAEWSNGTNVEDYYKLEKTLIPKNGKYSLVLSEFESEHSYFDQVKLMAVDHESDVNIAVTSNGEILTYKNPTAPISAIDNNGSNRLNEISLMDGNVSDPATYFYGQAGDYLILNFGQVNSDSAKLILRTDMKKNIMDEKCILVQVKDGSGIWQTVEVLVPRAYWSIEAVNLSPYVVQGQDLTVRLYWNYHHRLDYVGLDTTPQASYEIRTANQVSAVHSTQGDVKNQLQESDNIYTELVPYQQIQLEFTLPNNTKETRTCILYTKGHYYTIP